MDGDALLAARMVGIAAGFPVIAYLFGSSILRRATDLDDEERLAASWGVSFAFVGFGQFAGFVLHVPPAMCALGLLTFMLLVVLRFRFAVGSAATKAPAGRPLKVAFIVVYLHLVCIQALLPNYRGGNWAYDWWMHYDAALIFAGQQSPDTVWLGSYNLASRTPLFNLTTASVMSLAGCDFAVFQLASALPGCVFVLPLYLVLRNLFDRRAGLFGVLLAALNVWMMHNAWFTWPKMLAAYYILLGLHFYLQAVRSREREPAGASRYYLYAVCCAALGYMTHQVALVYFLPLVLHAAVLGLRNRAFRPRPAEVAASILAVAFLLAPWYGWLMFQFGWRQIVGATPATAMNPQVTFRFKHVLRWTTVNTAQSLYPVELAAALHSGPVTFTGAYRGLTALYFSLLPGALTLSLTVFLGCALLGWCGRKLVSRGGTDERDSPKGREWAAVWCFALFGYAGAALLHPTMFGHGIAHSAAFPTVVVVTGVAWGLLSRRRLATVAVVTAGIVTEFLLVFWSHWWLLLHRPEVLEDLPGNEALKTGSIGFLSETLPGAQAVLIGAAVVIQVALVTLLVRLAQRDRAIVDSPHSCDSNPRPRPQASCGSTTMPDTPKSNTPSVEEVQARLHEVARMLQQSGSLDPEARRVLAELVDELGVALRGSNAPPAEVAHLAESAAHLAESLHYQRERGILATAQDRLNAAVLQAEAKAPVASGLARQLLDALGNIGI